VRPPSPTRASRGRAREALQAELARLEEEAVAAARRKSRRARAGRSAAAREALVWS
jgi:hypothetical protein